MTSDDVQRLVETAVASHWDRENRHGCTPRRCLVEPKRCRLWDPRDDEMRELWLVLDEDPDTPSGYQVVYDEATGTFGLACPGFDGVPTVLGFYNSFSEAFEAM